MFKKTFQAFVFGGAMMAAGSSQAGLYWDVDWFSYADGYVSEGAGNSLPGTFDISENRVGGNYQGTDEGGSEAVTSVLFEFTLLDDKDARGSTQTESWQINLSDTQVSGDSIGWFGAFVFGSGNATLRADIEEDGQVAYEISSNGGDFRVLNAAITVCTETRHQVNRVPDGGMTLALFGAGLLGLGVLRRRF